MRRLTTTILAACAAVALSATLASAQMNSNKDTVVTFSAPVSLPGVTLPAGSYLFKLADSQVNRNIVQVFDKDRSKIFATILAIPAERNEPADDTVITFNESPANSAPAIRYWYFPGDKRGQEFAYPKAHAATIANAAHTTVLAVNSDASDFESMKDAEITRVEPGADVTQSATQDNAAKPAAPAAAAPAQPAEIETAPAAAAPAQPAQTETAPAAPAAEPSASAAATTQSPAAAPERPAETPTTSAAQSTQPSAETQQPRASSSSPSNAQPSAVGTSGTADTLPKTASPLPLIGFAGLLALGGACGVRALRRVRA
jgi:hypothetical protein